MDDDILLALKEVIDPELGINVVDLGLVFRAAHASDRIEVALGMTSPACPLGEMMVEDARLALQKRFPEVSSIQVELIQDLPWSPERMSEEGRRELGVS
jgi:metal-sulfur cluster biosynthetic enzyme